MQTYRYIQDPGHGWLEVDLQEVERLGIGAKVSSYSYVNEDKAYLEEDCDLSLFLRAKESASEPFKLVEVYQQDTPIRTFDRYGK